MDLLNDDFNVTEVLKKNGFEFNKKIEKDIDDKTNEVVYKQSNNI